MKPSQLKKLLQEKSPKEIFGDEPDKTYKKYAAIAHPDRNKGDETLFKLLSDKYTELTQGLIITSKNGKYEIDREPFVQGDISDLFLTKKKDLIVQVSRSDKFIQYMKNAESVLKAVRPDPKEKPSTASYFPDIVDAFTIKTRNYPSRRVHVSPYNEEHVGLERVHEVHKFLDPRSFAWIFKRMLVTLAQTHRSGYVHGSVLPKHILVGKNDHGAKIVGWISATKIGEPIKIVDKTNKDFYAPEILAKEPATPETDIYMAAKCAIYMLGDNVKYGHVAGTVPAKIRGFLRALLIEKQSRRPDDAWQLHCDFDDMLKRVFGKPKYVKLEV